MTVLQGGSRLGTRGGLTAILTAGAVAASLWLSPGARAQDAGTQAPDGGTQAQSVGTPAPDAGSQAQGGAVSPTALLDLMSDAGLYRQIESYRLAGDTAMERAACEAMLARFPQSPFAPKAKYELVLMGLRSAVNYDQAVARLLEVNQDYPGSSFGSYAQQMHKAFTDPATALDVQILVQHYRETAKVHYDDTLVASLGQTGVAAGQDAALQNSLVTLFSEHHPLSEAMVIQRLLSFYDSRPMLDWLLADRSLAVGDRAALAADIAEMMYRSPLRDRWDQSRQVCEWVLANFASQKTACAQALRLLGELDLRQTGDLDAAEAHFRALAHDFDGAESFCALAHRHYMAGHYAKAREILNEARARWPQSRWSLTAYQILGRREMVEAGGAPGAMTSAEQTWAALAEGPSAAYAAALAAAQAAADAAAQPGAGATPGAAGTGSGAGAGAAGSGTQGQTSFNDCGPYAFYLVCQRLGVPCSLAEAYDRCHPRADGTNSLFELFHAFLEKGLDAKAVEMGMDQLQALGADPAAAVVLHLPDHFKVLDSFGDGHFALLDQNGTASLTGDELGLSWDGYVLVVRLAATEVQAEAVAFGAAGGGDFFTQLAATWRGAGRRVRERVLTMEQLQQLASGTSASLVLNLPHHFPVLRAPGDPATADAAQSASTMTIEQLAVFSEGPALVVAHAPDGADPGTGALAPDGAGDAAAAAKLRFLDQLSRVLARSTNLSEGALQDLVTIDAGGLILHNPSRVLLLERLDESGAVLSDGVQCFRVSPDRLRLLWDGRVLIVQ